MSEPENFLARWSRRKAEAEQPAERAPETPRKADQELRENEVTAEAKDDDSEKEGEKVDLSKLPPIESIGPETDIRAFLQKGIPPELTKAALRRVWTSDPAIRNFIGIAENQYDFATGSDIPGFGPLTPADDVAGMVSRIMREGVPREPSMDETQQAQDDLQAAETEGETVEVPVVESSTEDTTTVPPTKDVSLETVPSSHAAVQHEDVGREDDTPPSHVHGGALPR